MEKSDRIDMMEALKAAYKAVDDKMGEDIMVLDIHEVSLIADYFIIASANNPNQLKAIADNVQEKLAEQGISQKSIEGVQSARWILMDFGHIIVQLFCKEEREYYRLERLWSDGKLIPAEELA